MLENRNSFSDKLMIIPKTFFLEKNKTTYQFLVCPFTTIAIYLTNRGYIHIDACTKTCNLKKKHHEVKTKSMHKVSGIR